MSSMQDIFIKEPLPADQMESTRRGFLKLATGTITFFMGLVIGIPIIGTVVGPVFRTKKPYWAKVAELNSLPVGKPVKLTFASQTVSAYIRETILHDVWAIKHPTSEITVLSPICPHLGCEYNWNPQSSHFECPCHGSVFALDGKVLGGPAPRPLDTLPTKVDGGNLFVEWETFKIGVVKKIVV
jgi:quinol---cytochrome c reductase iron-sulfur subunit, bacillus type